MQTLAIEDTYHPAYPAGHPGGPCAEGYAVFFNHSLVGTIDLDDYNNWCANPLDAPPLTGPFTDRWDAALAIVRSRR